MCVVGSCPRRTSQEARAAATAATPTATIAAADSRQQHHRQQASISDPSWQSWCCSTLASGQQKEPTPRPRMSASTSQQLHMSEKLQGWNHQHATSVSKNIANVATSAMVWLICRCPRLSCEEPNAIRRNTVLMHLTYHMSQNSFLYTQVHGGESVQALTICVRQQLRNSHTM